MDASSILDPEQQQKPPASLSGCLFAAHGLYMIGAGLALAAFGLILPTLLVKVVTSGVIDPGSVAPVARMVIDHRGLMPLIAAPAIVFGVLGVMKLRPHWLWAALGFLSILLPGVLLIYTFLATVGMLYQVNPL